MTLRGPQPAAVGSPTSRGEIVRAVLVTLAGGAGLFLAWMALQIDQLLHALNQGLWLLEQKMTDFGFAPASTSGGSASISLPRRTERGGSAHVHRGHRYRRHQ